MFVPNISFEGLGITSLKFSGIFVVLNINRVLMDIEITFLEKKLRALDFLPIQIKIYK